VSGEIGAGDRLMTPYQVEHDAAVDIAGGLAGCHLKVGEINFSHLSHFDVST
jgi:hypothetical protein